MSDSNQEIEAKFYVTDLGKIETRLQKLGAVLLHPRILERNIRFDLPDGSLRSEHRVLRLRRDTEVRLTYKDPSQNQQGVLSRREIEFIVEDFDKAKQFLEALGYQPIFYYEKYRTVYGLQTSKVLVHTMLDELPYGNFVEIEGGTLESIRAVAYTFDLNWDAAIGKSYNALFEQLSAIRPNLDPTQLTFAALNGLNVKAEELSVRAADS